MGQRKTEDAGRDGFTLIELITVLAVVSIITVVALTSLRGGLYSQYTVSQTSRKLVVALQEARMRAFQNEQATQVKTVANLSGDIYKITFVDSAGKCDHGFIDRDYAAFSGITDPVGLNGGAYLVTTHGDNYIQLSYEGEATAGTASLGTPLARNVTAASELVIRPRDPTKADGDPAQRGEFVYDSKRVVVWNANCPCASPGNLPGGYDPGFASPCRPDIPISARDTLPGKVVLRFTGRGFTADDRTGYPIMLAQRKANGDLDYVTDAAGNPVTPYTLTRVSWITVSPFGIVKTGKTDYASP